jgi:hypothetical protein
MYCEKCGNELNSTDRYCNKCGNVQVIIAEETSKKRNNKLKNKKVVLIGVSVILLLAIVAGLLFIVKSNKVCQDGVVTSLFGEEYYVPKKITQYATNGEEKFSYEISMDENDDNYYLKLFFKDSDDDSEEKIKDIDFDSNGYISSYSKIGKYSSYNYETKSYEQTWDTVTYSIDNNGLLLKYQNDNYSYNDENQLVSIGSSTKITYDDESRIIRKGNYTREYGEDNTFKYIYNTDWWNSKGTYNVEYDEYNHPITITEDNGVNIQCEYEYDSNGCITKCKYSNTQGRISTRVAEYQKVSKTDYINYMTVCACEEKDFFVMPMDCVHSSLFFNIDPYDMVSFIDWL